MEYIALDIPKLSAFDLPMLHLRIHRFGDLSQQKTEDKTTTTNFSDLQLMVVPSLVAVISFTKNILDY